MRVWIDATQHDEQIEVFGMTLLERLLRGLLDAQRQISGLEATQEQLPDRTEASGSIADSATKHLELTEVRIELAPGTPFPRSVPQPLLDELPITWSTGNATLRERLREATLEAEGEPLIALSADSVIDRRVLEHIILSREPRVFFSSEASEASETIAVLRLETALDERAEAEAEDLFAIATSCVDSGVVKPLAPGDFDGYIPSLRRTLPAYLFRIVDADAVARVERFLYESNCKGATDFLTKYAYPPLVRRALGPLTRRRVHPDRVTAFGIVCCFAAVPFFAAGWWLPGLLLGYLMTVLDSVDGKLARVTFTSSKRGRILDHGTDIVHPPIWYWAWAWGLSGGNPFSPVFQASLWLAGLYVADRVVEALFKSRTGRSVQDYTPLDTRLRTFVSRRNVNLALFTLALPLGLGVEAFYAILALQLATAVYHLARLIQFWDAGKIEEKTRKASSDWPRVPLATAASVADAAGDSGAAATGSGARASITVDTAIDSNDGPAAETGTVSGSFEVVFRSGSLLEP